MLKEIAPERFREEVEEAPQPVLVEFYAAWCPKCAMMEDVVTQFAAENDGRIKVCRIDADKSGQLMGRFGLDRVPAFLSFRDGKVTGAVTGIVAGEVLAGMF